MGAFGHGGPPPRRPQAEGPKGSRRFSAPSLKGTFVALEEPLFARYFAGSMAFFFAMQMQMLLRGYLVYDLTGDPLLLGLISLSFALPMVLVSPIGGVIADRVDRRTLIVVSQAIGLVLTTLTTVLILLDVIEFWHLFVISTLAASAMTFNMPARMALVPQLVGQERMMNAIALNSGGMNVSRIAAPALAGLLVAPLGIGGAYVVTLVFNLIAVVLFFNIGSHRAPARMERRSFLAELGEGFRYVGSNQLLLILLAAGLVPMFLAMPHQSLLPVFAEDVWDVGARGLGLLQTMAGVGGLIGAAVAANLSSVRRPAWVMSGAMVMFGVFIALFAVSPAFIPALILVLCGDIFAMVGQTTNNALVQRIIPDEVRGRVMSLMMMSFGLTPLGVLPAGWVAREFGVRSAVAGGGVILVVVSALIYLMSARYRSLDGQAATAEDGDPAERRPLRPRPGGAG